MKYFILPSTLAARSLDTRLAKRVQGKLDALKGTADCIVDHLKGRLVGARLGWLTTIYATAQPLLLACCVYLLFQVLTLQHESKNYEYLMRELNGETYIVLLELVEVID